MMQAIVAEPEFPGGRCDAIEAMMAMDAFQIAIFFVVSRRLREDFLYREISFAPVQQFFPHFPL
ncbi:hypothetical protein QEZ47_11850 [Aminobacter anthyllidis]|uniref:hypothetical protein n=1 Tax=Aminobacter anthyllidis TaxID=1035067 RepID=UPI0024542C53|nr:hypothetical protein [Aminobacter anthyllidis]MDH4986215.1 hypothetical protein [Aminobacter anthyllidis]